MQSEKMWTLQKRSTTKWKSIANVFGESMTWGSCNMSKSSHLAFPQFPETEAVIRLQAVKRWHMIETTRTQTLAEHTANVALLAWSIARTSPGAYFQSNTALIGALLHDLGETFMGDIPTHTKRAIGKEIVDSVESGVLPETYSLALDQVTLDEHLLIKLCDLADGIRFIRLYGIDGTARHAQEGLEEQLTAKMHEADQSWSDAIYQHVRKQVMFYAYEQA